MAVNNLVQRCRISDVWRALGGAEPRHGRAPAIWRGTRDRNVALDDENGLWYDFRDGIGGGILSLVEKARGCSRQDALQWLADFAGVALDDKPFSATDRVRWARARQDGRDLARVAFHWLQARMAELSDAKCEAVSDDRFDVSRLAPAARGLRRLESLGPDGIVREYLSARKIDPEHTRELERVGRDWEKVCRDAAGLVIGEMERQREAVWDAAS